MTTSSKTNKQKVIITRGLPGAGKTFWAKKMVESHQGHYKRISKDALRAMLDNGIWSKSNEQNILYVRDNLMNMLLVQGYSVIIDDTNLAPKHEETIRGEVLELMGKMVKVEVKDFTDVSLEECIKRDQKRPNPVGEKVIKDMYKNFLKPKIEPIKYDPKLPPVILCDLDGTLALFGDANPYERDFEKDKINTPIYEILMKFQGGVDLIFITGRQEKYIPKTKEFLRNSGLRYEKILFRKNDDLRKDSIIKQELYEANIKGKYNVFFVLDDRDSVVEMWRDLGLTCLQVAEGDF